MTVAPIALFAVPLKAYGVLVVLAAGPPLIVRATTATGRLTCTAARVTAPTVFRARPVRVEPAPRVIAPPDRIVPTKIEPAPVPAAPVACQNTWVAWAPLTSRTMLASPVSSAPLIWKMNRAFGSPAASRVRIPFSAKAVLKACTPGRIVAPPWSPASRSVGVRPAALATAATMAARTAASPSMVLPVTSPGGKPVSEPPADRTPRSPRITVAPVLVTVSPNTA